MATLQEATKTPTPLVNYLPSANDTGAIELFAKARTGDATALVALRKLILDRKWEEWIGNLGTLASRQIIARGTACDEVWNAGINEKLSTLWKELGGATAPMLEKLLIRRILNNWLSVHMLEIQQAVRPPVAIMEREYLDRSLSRAQKRYTEAISALARVRQLNIPIVLAQVNVTCQVMAADGSTRLSSSPDFSPPSAIDSRLRRSVTSARSLAVASARACRGSQVHLDACRIRGQKR